MTPAIKLLDRAGVPYQLHSYTHDDACTDYGLEASTQLGVDPRQMFKTLIVRSVAGQFAMALLSVQDRLDLKKLATAFDSKKADLAEVPVAEKMTGYVVGGISPLGCRKPLPAFIDSSIQDCETVYLSAGKRGLQLQLTPVDLIKLTNAKLAPLAASGSR